MNMNLSGFPSVLRTRLLPTLRITTLATEYARGRWQIGLALPCLLDEDLLLLLEVVGELDGDVERLGDEVGRGEGEPLREGDVGDAVGLVDFDPDEVLVLGSVFDVVPDGRFCQRAGPC